MLCLKKARFVAKIVFKFLEVSLSDGDVDSFIKKMEEVLKGFAGEAYHFRYYLEDSSDDTSRSNTQANDSKRHHLSGCHRLQ